jgi:adenosylcobinamide-GDP ribazoletransferase
VTELAALALPIGVAVLLGMAATVLVTGGFHEDGFADSCDGFGGGWDKGRCWRS